MLRQAKEFFRIVLVAIVIVIIITLSLQLPGCLVKEAEAVSALDKMGYSNIIVTNRNNCFIKFHGGGEGDDVMFTCSATNPAGIKVDKIYVFAGWPFKKPTVR
jgi:hypothetical protein